VAQDRERLMRGEQRPRPQEQVEDDHVSVQVPELSFHGAAHSIRKSFASAEGKPEAGAKSSAVTRTATKTRPARKSLSDYITERFDDFSRSQKDVARYIVDHLDEAAFQTAEELARRANTSSSTVVRFSQALGFEGYPELQQSAIEEYRLKVAEGAAGTNANGSGGAAALFNFDHSEFEASLGADYSNIEETARSLTREQVEASVSAIATSRRVLIVGTDQMAFFASYLRHLLGLLDVRAEIVSSASQDNIQKLSRMDDDTLLVALTAGRANPLVLRALKLARHRRSRTMSITDATLSDVAEYSELVLYYSSNGPSYIRSNAALMGLVQALAHGVYARDEAVHRDRIRAFKLK
jgi:DNA-binding MurR/RpiR family transcriptional regulator